MASARRNHNPKKESLWPPEHFDIHRLDVLKKKKKNHTLVLNTLSH